MRYSAYGIPFGLPAGDANSNGERDGFDDDRDIIVGWINTSTYDVRGDLDLDGDVDNDDLTAFDALSSVLMGWKILSSEGNRKGYAGYEADFTRDYLWHVRNRVLESELGRWTRRDPLGYVDGMGLYEYGMSNPAVSRSQDVQSSTSGVGSYLACIATYFLNVTQCLGGNNAPVSECIGAANDELLSCLGNGNPSDDDYNAWSNCKSNIPQTPNSDENCNRYQICGSHFGANFVACANA